MTIRNGWRIGDHLVVDDLSGFVEWASDCVKRYDGILMLRRGNEDEVARHPQEFVKARRDPKALRDVRPEPLVDAPTNTLTGLIYAIGPNLFTRPRGAATHLFEAAVSGIGTIVKDAGLVENPFIVRVD